MSGDMIVIAILLFSGNVINVHSQEVGDVPSIERSLVPSTLELPPCICIACGDPFEPSRNRFDFDECGGGGLVVGGFGNTVAEICTPSISEVTSCYTSAPYVLCDCNTQIGTLPTPSFEGALIFPTYSGGLDNEANGYFSSIGGGLNNKATGRSSTIAGGENNDATGTLGSTISGGFDNVASARGSVVGGGNLNTASGEVSVVIGGSFNTASGLGSIAMGANANAKNDQSLVINLGNNPGVSSKKDNEFLVNSKSFTLQIGKKKVTINKNNIQNFKKLLKKKKGRRHLLEHDIINNEQEERIEKLYEQNKKQQEQIDKQQGRMEELYEQNKELHRMMTDFVVVARSATATTTE